MSSDPTCDRRVASGCKGSQIKGLRRTPTAHRVLGTCRGLDRLDLVGGLGTVATGAPQRPRPGAHPFWPGDRAMHGTVPAAVAREKKSLNLWRNSASEKKSAVEIDAGAFSLALQRGKGLAATHVAEGVEYPPKMGLLPPSELILEVGV